MLRIHKYQDAGGMLLIGTMQKCTLIGHVNCRQNRLGDNVNRNSVYCLDLQCITHAESKKETRDRVEVSRFIS